MSSKTINNSKILVTGGAGFIGSNLCEYFLNDGTKFFRNYVFSHRHSLTFDEVAHTAQPHIIFHLSR
ncbi:MAG TPA: GDP-mannose 4,6-dehydratase [Bacteroidales bacterium]|nr:GDP-mannose 4,6-dehydratase [Bacteroidales bacterium]